MKRILPLIVMSFIIMLLFSPAVLAHEDTPNEAHTGVQDQHSSNKTLLWLPETALLLGSVAVGLATLRVSPSKLARWGGIAGVVGGVLTVANIILHILPSSYLESVPTLNALLSQSAGLLGPTTVLLLTASLAGLHALLGEQSRLGNAGVTLSCLSAVALALLLVYGTFFDPQYSLISPPQVASSLETVLNMNSTIWSIGLVLLSTAAFGARILGRWRVLPLALGLLTTPIPVLLILMLLGQYSGILLPLLGLVAGLGWVLLGHRVYRSAEHQVVRGDSSTTAFAT